MSEPHHELLAEGFERAHEAAFLVDAGGRYLAANAAAAALTGYSIEEIVALPPGGLNALGDRGATHRVEVAIGLRRDGLTHLLRSDGSVIAVRFYAVATEVDGERAFLALCSPA